MKGYVARRLSGMKETRKPMMFSKSGYLSDLGLMANKVNEGVNSSAKQAMMALLSELEIMVHYPGR